MVLAVGLPQLPQPDDVLKPSPEIPPNSKIVHEVTETTHIKVKHSHNFDVASYVLTSETVKENDDCKPIVYDNTPKKNKEVLDNKLSSFSEQQLKRLEQEDHVQAAKDEFKTNELRREGRACEKAFDQPSAIEESVAFDSLAECDEEEREKLRQIKEVSERFEEETIKSYNYVTKHAIKSYF